MTALTPWVVLSPDPDAAVRAAAEAGDDVAVVLVRGRACRTPDGLHREFARAWRFPDYYGYNWNALDDCLTDLSWLPAAGGYRCLVTDADHLLAEAEPGLLGLLVDLLGQVGAHWAAPVERGEPFDRPAREFRTLLVCPGQRRLRHLADRIRAAPGTGGPEDGPA